MNKKTDKAEYEICVMCGNIMDVRTDEPIENRPTYMPAAGQLCVECCKKIYGVDDLRPIRW